MRSLRYRLAGGLALALMVTGLAGFRVFAPADTLDPANAAYPQPAAAVPGLYGELLHAPLIVAGRVRVYGAQNRVWADGPVDAKMSTSAYWALRRWPARLVGVVVAADRMVVAKWSDGELTAIDPATGRIRWRVGDTTTSTSYQGRRTGAQTLYEPTDLYTATGPGGAPVVVSTGPDTVTAFDADSGRRLWRRTVAGSAGCRTEFTGPGLVAVFNRCRPSTVEVYDAVSGAARTWAGVSAQLRPVGCAVGRSGCTGLSGAEGFLIGADGGLVPAPGLAVPDGRLLGRTVLRVAGGRLHATDALTGAAGWIWPVAGGGILGIEVVAVEPRVVHVVTRFRDLINLDPGSGAELSHFSLRPPDGDTPWVPGYGYATGGFVVVERLRVGATPDRNDGAYYHPVPSLVLAGS
jgi:hypothetical protein